MIIRLHHHLRLPLPQARLQVPNQDPPTRAPKAALVSLNLGVGHRTRRAIRHTHHRVIRHIRHKVIRHIHPRTTRPIPGKVSKARTHRVTVLTGALQKIAGGIKAAEAEAGIKAEAEDGTKVGTMAARLPPVNPNQPREVVVLVVCSASCSAGANMEARAAAVTVEATVAGRVMEAVMEAGEAMCSNPPRNRVAWALVV